MGGASTYFSYMGDRLTLESSYSGGAYFAMRDYVYDGGQPYLWHEGGYTVIDNRYLHTDRLGSVVATTNSGGAVTAYTYGPYGEPQTWAGSRFRYTGQMALPEAQLYHYRARAYDPMLGRFLQTDPIGYGDGPNVYAYVHGDPVNGTDPKGTSSGNIVDEFVVTAATPGTLGVDLKNFIDFNFNITLDINIALQLSFSGPLCDGAGACVSEAVDEVVVTGVRNPRNHNENLLPASGRPAGGPSPQNDFHLPTLDQARCFAWQAGDVLGKIGTYGTSGSLGAQGVGWGTVGVGAVTIQPEIVVAGGVIIMTGEAGAGFFSTVGVLGSAIKALTGDAASAGAGLNSALGENRLTAIGAPKQAGQVGALGIDELQDRLGIEQSPCGHGK